MKCFKLFVVVAALLLTCTVGWGAEQGLVWQIGVANGRPDEFIDAHIGHWQFDAPLLHTPGFDRTTGTYTYRVPGEGVVSAPAFPSAISTLEDCFILGDHVPRRIVIEWEEKAGGPRVFELHSAWWYNDTTWSTPAHAAWENYHDYLQVDTPDDGALRFKLPLTNASAATPAARGEGDLSLRVPFVSKPGMNRLTLFTCSYTLMSRIYFDYLALRTADTAEQRKPVIILSTPRIGNAFFRGTGVADKIIANAEIHNLSPTTKYTLVYEVHDFFRKLVETERLSLKPDINGSVRLKLQPNIESRGHFKFTARLLDSKGKMVHLGQCIDIPILPIAVLFPPEKPSPDDYNSRFGLVGGMCGYSNNQSLIDADRFFKIAYIMGARWHRFDMFSWRMIEPAKGDFHWGPVDNMVDLVRRNNINIMGEFTTIPDWAKLDPAAKTTHVGIHELPRLEDFTRFARETVTRFKGKVSAWEYMNEPENCYGMYKPKEYGEMMKTVTPMIRQIDPAAKVVMGCAGIDGNNRPWTVDAVKTSGTDAFDVFTYHYVGSNPWKYCKELIDEVGVQGKPVWDTEQHFNWGVPMEEEARELVRTYSREFSYGIDKVFYFDLMFNMVWGTSDIWFSPLMVAYRVMAHRVDHTSYLCPISPARDIEGYAFTSAPLPAMGGDLRIATPKLYRGRDSEIPTHQLPTHQRTVLVLWNNAAAGAQQRNDAGSVVGGKSPVAGAWREVRLRVGTNPVTLIDMMDNERIVHPKDGTISIELGADPVFIEGVSRANLLAMSALVANPAQNVVKSGGVSTHRLTLKNTFGGRARGRLVFAVPSGLKVTCLDPTFDLQPGTTKEFATSVSTPARAGYRVWRITAEPVLTSGKSPLSNASCEIDVVTHPLGIGANVLRDSRLGKGFRSASVDVLPGQFYSLGLTGSGRGQAGLRVEYSDASGKPVGGQSVASRAIDGAAVRMVGLVCAPRGAARMWISGRSDGTVKLSDPEVRLQQDANVNLNKLAYSWQCAMANKPTVIDGDISKWESSGIKPIVIDNIGQVRRRHWSGAIWNPEPYDWRGPDDLSAKVYTSWDAQNLYVAAKVKDDSVIWGTDPGSAWAMAFAHPWGDALQIAIDPDNGATDYSFEIFTIAAGRVMLTNIEDYTTRYIMPTGKEISSDMKFAMKPVEGGVVYEIAIPWKMAPGFEPGSGQALGFQVQLMETDKNVYRGFMSWPPRQFFELTNPADLGEMWMVKGK